MKKNIISVTCLNSGMVKIHELQRLCARSTFVQWKLLQTAIFFCFELVISLNANLVSEQELTAVSNCPTKEYRYTVKSSKEKKSS